MKKLLVLMTISSLSLVACIGNLNTGPVWTDVFTDLFSNITLEQLVAEPQSLPTNNRDQVYGDVAFVSLTGGPEFETKTNYYYDVFESKLFSGVNKNQYKTYSMNYVIQGQVHAYNAKWFGNEQNTTLELANKLNDETLKATNRLVLDLNSKGKTVILLGHSYGSFLVNRYLATYGTNFIDMVISSAGRLNFNNRLAGQLTNGGYGIYYQGKTIKEFKQGSVPMNCETPYVWGVSSCTFWDNYRELPEWVWNEGVTEKQKWDSLNRDGIFLRLQGDIVGENYINSIGDAIADQNITIDESKVHFMFGQKDYTVGIVQQEEMDFISTNNFNICNEDEGHNNDGCFQKIAKTIQTKFLKK